MADNKLAETQEKINQSTVDIECFGLSDVGRERSINQDHFVIGNLQKHLATEHSSLEIGAEHAYGKPMGKLLLVADGMGGANAGEVASELAINSTLTYLLSSMHWLAYPTEAEVERFVEDLKEAACFSHFSVRETADNDPYKRGMGSTLTVAYIDWPMLYVLHIGDSRCYIHRKNELHLLTKDQTFAQHLFDCGHLNQEEFENSSYHHILVSAIGAEGQPDAVVYRQRLRHGDQVLLCSDGVNLHLEDNQIEQVMNEGLGSEQICQRLIQSANEAGGKDNITAVVAKFLAPSS